MEQESELRSEHLQGNVIPALQAGPAPAVLAEPGAVVGAGLGSSTGAITNRNGKQAKEEGPLAGGGFQFPDTCC